VNRKETFGEWLQQSLWFIKLEPWIWCSYTLSIAVIMMIGKVSLALGVFCAVASFFVGVGVAKYIDMKHASETSQPLSWAINKSLPLAILAAIAITVCWFVFMAFSNLMTGDYNKILQFFFHWDYINIKRRSVREIAGWIYEYGNAALIFTLLMMCTFGSWFSYPLMLFQDYSWKGAKQLGDSTLATRKKSLYNMLAFIIFEALMCSALTPLLTPVLYMLTSTLMYVSYKNLFEIKA
jgi:hypothetical protein